MKSLTKLTVINMSTTQEKISAISVDLDKRIDLAEESLKESKHTLSLIKNDAETYNQAWEDFASISAINHFLLQLKDIIESGDNKKAENFIRFNCHQIEQFTDKAVLEADENTGLDVLDVTKIAVYYIFKSYVEILDAE